MTENRNPALIGSIAIIRRFVDETEQWLTLWDSQTGQYRLIQSERGEEETFRSCLNKDLEEELGLSRARDFIISGFSMAHHQAPIEWPNEETPQWVIVQFFPVQLYGQSARTHVDSLEDTKWLSLSEIANGQSVSGKPFCPRQQLLIERANLIPEHLISR